ncbi:MAG TPA: acyl-CoA dehydrogenase family protein, partial [Croceicoccus sp.]|nr:acyl-CoA dehydrogenase family protein [Croceicoccus sp.]
TPYAASMAKLVASEAAGRIVDKAVQLSGGAGVTRGNLVEKLYREVRAMRIYEGASEVQKLIVGRGLLKGSARP